MTTIKLKREKVTRIYIGKANKCCCGCSGKYTERSDKRFGAKADQVDRALAEAHPVDIDASSPTYIAVDVGNRVLIAYFD